MNNRNHPSAATSRAGEIYVLDLTSVCVRSGTIRLPLSLLGRFEEGELIAHAGGEELNLQFQAPRTLLGLAAFFEKSELKSNDRVSFEFDGDRLELRALRRERHRSVPARPQQDVELQRAAKPPAGNDGSARLSARGVFPAPAELLNAEGAKPDAQGAAEAAGQDAVADAPEPQRERRNENSVRAVQRVRIEGGTPPRADTPAPRPIDRASARDVWARRQNPTWRSLDTTVAGPVVPPDEAEEVFSDTTVRVIRRSKGTSTPLDAEAPAAAPAPKAPVSYSTSWPLEEKPRRAERRQADAERAELDPYLDAPLDFEREKDYVPAAISENDLYSPPADAARHRESEQAYERFRGASDDEPAGQRERRPGLLGRLGLTRNSSRSDGAAASSSASGDAAEREAVPVAVPRSNGADDSSQKSFATLGTGEPPTSAHAVPAYAPSPAFGQASSASAVAEPVSMFEVESEPAPVQAPEPRVIVDDSVYDLEYDTAVLVSGAEDGPDVSDVGASLDGDIAILEGYFERPDVPAIVRCDDLAVRLSMGKERVVHAMSRLAEDRERFTALRGDAYMIRRAR